MSSGDEMAEAAWAKKPEPFFHDGLSILNNRETDIARYGFIAGHQAGAEAERARLLAVLREHAFQRSILGGSLTPELDAAIAHLEEEAQ